ncbi:MAG: 6-pyruvoyl tetrahydropterin synthase family protein [Caulobacteraceae bacterium]|nr:6-pyruvoyl tetrahydropterin synthase family protein [Caulobacteraceae bacterium]
MTEPVFEITRAAGFDAAHRLPDAPGDAGYGRLHGHSFTVEATLRGPVRAGAGWVEDLGAVAAALKRLAGELDHSLLNDHEGLETPTLEALCLWFARRLEGDFAGLARVRVARPTVGEACVLEVGRGP